jgi:hypothetical protein
MQSFSLLITFWHNYAIFLTSLLLFVLVHWENERLFITVSNMIDNIYLYYYLYNLSFFSPEIISFYVTKVIPLTTFPSCLLSRTLVGVWIAFSNSSSCKWKEISLTVFSATTYHSLLIFGIVTALTRGPKFRSIAYPLSVYRLTVKFLINAPPLIKGPPRPFDKENYLLFSAELITKAIILFKLLRSHSIL